MSSAAGSSAPTWGPWRGSMWSIPRTIPTTLPRASTQYLRLTPRDSARQSVVSWRIETPGTPTRTTDGYGNAARPHPGPAGERDPHPRERHGGDARRLRRGGGSGAARRSSSPVPRCSRAPTARSPRSPTASGAAPARPPAWESSPRPYSRRCPSPRAARTRATARPKLSRRLGRVPGPHACVHRLLPAPRRARALRLRIPLFGRHAGGEPRLGGSLDAGPLAQLRCGEQPLGGRAAHQARHRRRLSRRLPDPRHAYRRRRRKMDAVASVAQSQQ